MGTGGIFIAAGIVVFVVFDYIAIVFVVSGGVSIIVYSDVTDVGGTGCSDNVGAGVLPVLTEKMMIKIVCSCYMSWEIPLTDQSYRIPTILQF